MLEARRLDMEFKRTVGNRPEFRQRAPECPLAAAGRTAVVMAVRLPPVAGFRGGRPNDLGIGAAQDDISPTFQFFSVAGIEQFVIFPILSHSHEVYDLPFRRQIVSFVSP